MTFLIFSCSTQQPQLPTPVQARVKSFQNYGSHYWEQRDDKKNAIKAIEYLEDRYFILNKKEWKLKKEFGRMMPVVESYVRKDVWDIKK